MLQRRGSIGSIGGHKERIESEKVKWFSPRSNAKYSCSCDDFKHQESQQESLV